MADEFVRQKLREWGFQDHIGKFQGKSQLVNMEIGLWCIGVAVSLHLYMYVHVAM